MRAKVRTNIDPWNDKVYPELEVGKEYEVVDVDFVGPIITFKRV